MLSDTSQARFQLQYWPLPFRGCFVSYLFAYRGVPLIELTDLEENQAQKSLPPEQQAIPYVGPPVLHDLKTGRSLSQMPAIVLYVAPKLDLMPDDPFEMATSLKILMDCNDVLMEICRHNGSTMWQAESWREFRDERLPRWLGIFEESLNRGFIASASLSFADIATYALFGNMTRCLPELDDDVARHAPGIYAHCERIASRPSLARFVAGQERTYGKLYCGGHIEDSIRAMLAADSASATLR
ncbi:MAG: glutathione S-transferase family protein [Pseudomonadota bacterium]